MATKQIEEQLGKMNKIMERKENIFIDEYLLIPDAVSGIQKISFVHLFPGVGQVMNNGAQITVQGVLRYCVGYISEDPFSSFRTLTGRIEYSEIVTHFDGVENEGFIVPKFSIDKMDYAAINSRKVSLNAVIQMQLTMYGCQNNSYVVDIDHEEGVELLKRDEKGYKLADVKFIEDQSKGTLKIVSEVDEIGEIAWVNITQVKPHERLVDEESCLDLNIFAEVGYISSAGKLEIESVEWKAEKALYLDGNRMHSKRIYRCWIKDVKADAAEDEDGEMRVISISLDYGVFMEAYEETDLEYVEDAYFLDATETCEVETLQIIKEINTVHKTFEVKDYYEGVGSFKDVCITSSHIKWEHELQGGEVFVSGKIHMRGVLIPMEGEGVIGIEIEMSISQTLSLDSSHVQTKDDIHMVLEIEDILVSYIDEQKAEFQVNLRAEMHVFETKSVTVLKSIEKAEKIEKSNESESLMRVYYVSEGECSWEVCKRYRICKELLQAYNTEHDLENLEKGTLLVIGEA